MPQHEHRSTRLSSLQTREANVGSSLLTCTKESGLDEIKANQARDEGLHVCDDVVVLLRHHVLQGTHQRRQTEKHSTTPVMSASLRRVQKIQSFPTQNKYFAVITNLIWWGSTRQFLFCFVFDWKTTIRSVLVIISSISVSTPAQKLSWVHSVKIKFSWNQIPDQIKSDQFRSDLVQSRLGYDLLVDPLTLKRLTISVGKCYKCTQPETMTNINHLPKITNYKTDDWSTMLYCALMFELYREMMFELYCELMIELYCELMFELMFELYCELMPMSFRGSPVAIRVVPPAHE